MMIWRSLRPGDLYKVIAMLGGRLAVPRSTATATTPPAPPVGAPALEAVPPQEPARPPK